MLEVTIEETCGGDGAGAGRMRGCIGDDDAIDGQLISKRR